MVGGQVFRYQTCNHSLSNEVVVYLIEVLSPKRLVGFGNRHGIGIPCGTCMLEACTMYVCFCIYIHIHDMYACRKQNVLAQVTMFRTKRSGLEQSHGKIGNRSENAVATDPKRQDPT